MYKNANIVIAISGGIASGKTSFSHALSKTLGWPRCSFGGYVRKFAARNGIDPEDRAVLQALGEGLVDQNPEDFCASVLRQIDDFESKSLIVDGVRHLSILNELRCLLRPRKVILVHLDLTSEVRRDRIKEDSNRTLDEFEAFEAHSTERDVHTSLLQAADIVVDASKPIPNTVAAVISFLGYD